MHTQIDRIFKISLRKFTPFTCLNREAKKWGGILKRKLKVPSLVWNGKGFLGGGFEKILKNFWKIKKSPPDSSNREEKVFEILLNCKVSYRNRSVTNQLPKFENLLILGNKTAKMGLSHFVSLLCFLSVSFSDCKYKILVFANLLYWKLLCLML